VKTLLDLVPDLTESVLHRYYPHVAQNLVDFWGTSFFNDYIEQLSTTNRNDRSGFTFSALMEIQKVAEAHSTRFPHYKKIFTAWL
jgi:hypothetical protein